MQLLFINYYEAGKEKRTRTTKRDSEDWRKKGTVNITNQNFYDVLTLKIAERLPRIFEWLDDVDDPYQQITALLKIMEFRYPKQKAVEFRLDEQTSNTLEDKLYNLLQDPEK